MPSELAQLITVADIQRRATELIPDSSNEVLLDLGAQDTIAANLKALEDIRLVPRVLRGVTTPDLTTRVLNDQIDLPVMVAPAGGHMRVHAEGEVPTAQGAHAAGTLIGVSTCASVDIRQIATEAPGPLWFQLYIFDDQGLNEALIQRAEDAGCSALFLTVDIPGVHAGTAEAAHLQQLSDNNVDPSLRLGIFEAMDFSFDDGLGVPTMQTYMYHCREAIDWDDVAWVKSKTKLPVIIKGIQSVQDAKLCVEHGVDALVVSNHGGYAAASVPGTAELLPGIADAVAGGLEIYLDGGIRRGVDVLKCLALGARAVFVGRPAFWGSGVAGAEGVQQVFEILRSELEVAMRFNGLASVADVDSSLIFRP